MKKLFTLAAILLLFSTALTPRKITWVAIGDSITYLNDHPKETDNRITKGYMSLITEQYPQVEYINQGHNGWTSGGIAAKIESLGLVKADVYSIFLGTNDWWGGRPLGTLNDYTHNTGNNTVYGSFRIIINKLKELNSEAQILLITPMQRGDFVYVANFNNNAYGSYKTKNEQSLEQFANAIREIGKHEHISVVDLYHDKALSVKKAVNFKRLKNPSTGAYENYKYPTYCSIPFNPESDEYPYPIESIRMTYDGLHPSDKGYEIIAKRIIKKWKGLK
jgi:lysophospholipase L1-like esterase